MGHRSNPRIQSAHLASCMQLIMNSGERAPATGAVQESPYLTKLRPTKHRLHVTDPRAALHFATAAGSHRRYHPARRQHACVLFSTTALWSNTATLQASQVQPAAASESAARAPVVSLINLSSRLPAICGEANTGLLYVPVHACGCVLRGHVHNHALRGLHFPGREEAAGLAMNSLPSCGRIISSAVCGCGLAPGSCGNPVPWPHDH